MTEHLLLYCAGVMRMVVLLHERPAKFEAAFALLMNFDLFADISKVDEFRKAVGYRKDRRSSAAPDPCRTEGVAAARTGSTLQTIERTYAIDCYFASARARSKYEQASAARQGHADCPSFNRDVILRLAAIPYCPFRNLGGAVPPDMGVPGPETEQRGGDLGSFAQVPDLAPGPKLSLLSRSRSPLERRSLRVRRLTSCRELGSSGSASRLARVWHARHRFHPAIARRRRHRPRVHGPGRPDRSVSPGARARSRDYAHRRRAGGRRRLHGRRLCPRQRQVRRVPVHRRPGPDQHRHGALCRVHRSVAGARALRRGRQRHAGHGAVPGRHRRHLRRQPDRGAGHGRILQRPARPPARAQAARRHQAHARRPARARALERLARRADRRHRCAGASRSATRSCTRARSTPRPPPGSGACSQARAPRRAWRCSSAAA